MTRNRPRKNKIDAVLENISVPGKRVISEYSKGVRQEKTVQLKLRTEPIAWGFPLDELMFSKFFINVLRSLNIMPWDAIITTESTYLPDARNEIHSAFLRSARDIQYLAMVDSDVLCPPWTFDTLMNYDLPLCGGWYKHKVPENKDGQLFYQPVVYDFLCTEFNEVVGHDVNNYQRRDTPGEGLEKVDGLGAGCLLMRKDLAEALGERPYDMNAGGEDLVMCKKVYALSFDIHVDWNLACAHVGVNYV